ncbi:uroporphyrinogen decarboxylase [Fodinicurvata sediminis]|uniref:uroporphyrinogen decarboxylase n=1 Tax=Fodinicurvata sediminis TaxID=1121832 RepID=UPI00047CC39E|nr:uroporphyrinogen decarboxylase [Fodinicurvata sediminis]
MKPLLRALAGETLDPPPVWMMRQAGRYLPEYRELRSQAGSFLDLCKTPEMAEEVTLQPIRRYGLDGAILFSDILVVPQALGQKLWFEEGLGPRLEPLDETADLSRLSTSAFHERLQPVYETLKRLSQSVPQEVTRLGFAGAPWTVASYMIEGGSSRDFFKSRLWAYRDPAGFEKLIDLLVDVTSEYLIQQVLAGAETVQLFDSWAGIWTDEGFRRWSLAPSRRIIEKIHEACPGVPVIFFPRGAGVLYQECAMESGAQALSLDSSVPLEWARDNLQPHVALQGNLDPACLMAGGTVLDEATRRLVSVLGKGPFIFNLGHGIDKATPPENVNRMLEVLRGKSAQ